MVFLIGYGIRNFSNGYGKECIVLLLFGLNHGNKTWKIYKFNKAQKVKKKNLTTDDTENLIESCF